MGAVSGPRPVPFSPVLPLAGARPREGERGGGGRCEGGGGGGRGRTSARAAWERARPGEGRGYAAGAATWCAGESEHVGARGAPRPSRERPAEAGGGAVGEHPRVRPSVCPWPPPQQGCPGPAGAATWWGPIVRRCERSQVCGVPQLSVLLAAQQRKEGRLTARCLFQTPKNQIKQKKMAPPPKKVEDSEEEESSDLEESSGEEVIGLKMKSKACTCLLKCHDGWGGNIVRDRESALIKQWVSVS